MIGLKGAYERQAQKNGNDGESGQCETAALMRQNPRPCPEPIVDDRGAIAEIALARLIADDIMPPAFQPLLIFLPR